MLHRAKFAMCQQISFFGFFSGFCAVNYVMRNVRQIVDHKQTKEEQLCPQICKKVSKRQQSHQNHLLEKFMFHFYW